MPIAKPSVVDEVKKHLTKWNELAYYPAQENSLKKLFTETYPNNMDMDDVLIKVATLNTFYSTHIFLKQVPFVAEHIIALKLDQWLGKTDAESLKLVNELANVWFKNKRKPMNYYSFATKYCNHHYPEIYPIFDSYIEKVLLHFKKEDQFFTFAKDDLKDYPKYYEILTQFKEYYGLQAFNAKELDRYLWILGKNAFPKPKKPKIQHEEAATPSEAMDDE